MGKVLIKFADNHLESFKCKDKERAARIAGKRPNVKEWNYYEVGKKIASPKKKVTESVPTSFEELEKLMKTHRLIY